MDDPPPPPILHARPSDLHHADSPPAPTFDATGVVNMDLVVDGMEANERRKTSDRDSDPWASHDGDMLDQDTCRICRGEGTADEPLFYPCKCSGSIKFVHQDCLMEWLSHSQKKHCELCKTPFRFTKLYAPDMPRRLPAHVFLHHLAAYAIRNLLVWLRAALVTSVWLGWLPYLMRSVWSFLFWISDDGFGASSSLQHARAIASAAAASASSSQGISLSVTGTTTCPSTPLFATATSAASLMDHVPGPNVHGAMTTPSNSTTFNPWLRMLLGLSAQGLDLYNNVDISVLDSMLAKAPTPDPRWSLLSDVTFLSHLTRSLPVNRTIVSVLEGQVITLLVIVCFILIILVRDYVVQQQPEINMRAAFAAVENAENDMVPNPPQGEMPAVPADWAIPGDDSDDHDVPNDEDGEDQADDHTEDPVEVHEAGRRAFIAAAFENGMTDDDIEDMTQLLRARHLDPDTAAWYRGEGSLDGRGDGLRNLQTALMDGDSRATLPAHDERALDSDGAEHSAFARRAKYDYVQLHQRAGGDRDSILDIIRSEGLDESRFAPFLSRDSPSATSSVKDGKTSSESSSWTWAGSDDDESEAPFPAASVDKGKRRVVYLPAPRSQHAPEPSADQSAASSSVQRAAPLSKPYRPRAVSDGPQLLSNPINPLANNTWSFSNLSLEDPSSSQDVGIYEPAEPDPSTPADTPNPRHRPHSVGKSGNGMPNNLLQLPSSTESDHIATPSSSDSRSLAPRTDPDANVVDNVTQHISDEATDDMLVLADQDSQVVAAPANPSIVDRVADFMWGEVQPGDVIDGVNQEEAVDIFGDNQNVPFMHGGREPDPEAQDDMEEEQDQQEEAVMAPDVVEAAVAAGLDPEAIEDVEDFDGIMELIGMRGPIAGLFQNAVFCAFLVTISIFLGIFVPYNLGRVTVWVLANPARLMRIAFGFAKFVQDGGLLAVGYTSSFVFNLLEALRLLFGLQGGKQLMRTLRSDAQLIASTAAENIASSFLADMPLLSTTEIRNFSAISHHALVVLKSNIRYCGFAFGRMLAYVFGGDYLSKLATANTTVIGIMSSLMSSMKGVHNAPFRPSSWMISFTLPDTRLAVDPTLTYWSAPDRCWVILLGYATIIFIAALYLRRGAPFSTGQTAQEWEASIIDGLNQASGVMKVILIISIEMLVFPLYCGLLLDFALLPLFESTSFKSRLYFTYNYPLTSIFVHWFVGTGYMFHFALFVSMCRKIMRKGVLYFIRDPDDPEFHPVRDVLERNVTTQLRKILFSAFVYGALVVICLGGVVWGLSLTLPHVLPIHYSSNEPVLEFPIDLLFYNFLMPLAVKFFKPSDALHAMYTWWFRKCASALRLTWFLFGERRIEEEGKLTADPKRNLAWWRTIFLEVDENIEVVPKTWTSFFEGGKAKPSPKIGNKEMAFMSRKKRQLVDSGQLVTSGRFVRSPASDQVKIPKGQPVFVDVPEERLVQEWPAGPTEMNLYSDDHYQAVYIPPWFRLRIFVFIFSIWIFAAATGVSFTILPLVFGRLVFKALIPAHIRTNDIYAFSIGIYVLGSVFYLALHLHSALDQVKTWISSTIDSLLDRHAFQRALHLAHRAWKLVYTYTMLLVVFPILITVLVEIYVLVPLHTYMYPIGTQSPLRLHGLREGHTIRVIQAWTLGVLYLKLGSRVLTLYGGRPAQAVRAVLRRGWLEPDVGVLTRAFVVPGFIASAVMIFTPPVIAWAVLTHGYGGEGEMPYEMRVFAYRLAYPLTASFWLAVVLMRRLLGVFEACQVRIRDEAYLMGERLHNFTGAKGGRGWKGTRRV